MENVRIVAGIILIAVGLFVYITATFGLFRFHYVLNRMQPLWGTRSAFFLCCWA